MSDLNGFWNIFSQLRHIYIKPNYPILCTGNKLFSRTREIMTSQKSNTGDVGFRLD